MTNWDALSIAGILQLNGDLVRHAHSTYEQSGDVGPGSRRKLFRSGGLTEMSEPLSSHIFQQRRQAMAFDDHVVSGECNADFCFGSFGVDQLTPREHKALFQQPDVYSRAGSVVDLPTFVFSAHV